MGFAQRELIPLPQGDLFADAAPATYTPKPEHVLNRLVEMLADMRGASEWPWSPTRVKMNREIVWPYLLRLLPEADAARWRRDLEAEAARLESLAAQKEPDEGTARAGDCGACAPSSTRLAMLQCKSNIASQQKRLSYLHGRPAMNLHPETTILTAPRLSPSAISPVATDRIRALAVRAIEGAPALTAGEMRELAEAILDHNARSEQAADA